MRHLEPGAPLIVMFDEWDFNSLEMPATMTEDSD